MNIGELFVNLGIKGGEKTVGTLGNVKKGLGEVADMSLEAKAGILAALYGLEQMMAKSGAAGTGLTNFAALTGLSAKTLQQWQFAARQAGVAGEDLMGSVKGVQNSMANMLLGKGQPEGLGLVSNAVGGLDHKRFRDTFYMMEQLQKAAQRLPKDLGNNILKSFGLSEGTIAAMRLNKFNPSLMSSAPIYGDKEIASLNKSNIAWSNLGNKIEMAFGHFNSKHGQQIVGDISKIADAVFHLVEALVVLSEKLKVFQLIAAAANATAKSLEVLDAVVTDSEGKDTSKWRQKNLPEWFNKAIEWRNSVDKKAFDFVAPTLNPAGVQTNVHKTDIHQNIIHHGDAKDTKAVKDAHRQGVNNAYRQSHAQRRGS